MHLFKNKKEKLLKMALLSLGIVSVYGVQTASYAEAPHSSSSGINQGLKQFIKTFSNTVLDKYKSGLSNKKMRDELTEVAKTYVDIAGLCPFVFGRYYKQLCPSIRKELITKGLIANLVSQRVLPFLPHNKRVTVTVESTKLVNSTKRVKSTKRVWKVGTIYTIFKQSSVQTYKVTFLVIESGNGKFVISNVIVEGIDGRSLLREVLTADIKKQGLTETIEKLRKAAS